MIDLITRENKWQTRPTVMRKYSQSFYVVIMDNICSKNGEIDSHVELDFKTAKMHKKQEFDSY